MTKERIDFERNIKPLMDKSYTLIYVDYRDDLSNSLEAVQAAIHNPNNTALDEVIYFDEARWEGEREGINKLKEALIDKFELSDQDAEEVMTENEDIIRDEMNNRDDSDTLKDLIRNTGDQVFFYSTGVQIDDYTYPLKDRLREIKKILNIKQRDKTYDDLIEQMCCQASYGGELVIYFTSSIGDWLDWNNDNKGKNIVFTSYNLAIINTPNGSGDHTFLPHVVKLPFNREMLFLCRVIKYSYTYDVCGMSSNWCEDTNVSLEVTKSKKRLEKGKICEIQNKVLEYERIFKEGGCSYSDDNITRHRNTPYINEYPCRNQCSSCGHVWID